MLQSKYPQKDIKDDNLPSSFLMSMGIVKFLLQ